MKIKWIRVSSIEQRSSDKRFVLTVMDSSRRSRWVLLRDFGGWQYRRFECSNITEAKKTAEELTKQ